MEAFNRLKLHDGLHPNKCKFFYNVIEYSNYMIYLNIYENTIATLVEVKMFIIKSKDVNEFHTILKFCDCH